MLMYSIVSSVPKQLILVDFQMLLIHIVKQLQCQSCSEMGILPYCTYQEEKITYIDWDHLLSVIQNTNW